MREGDQARESLETTSAAVEEEAQKIVESSSLLNDNLVRAIRGIWRQLVIIWAVMIGLLLAYALFLHKAPVERASAPLDQPAQNMAGFQSTGMGAPIPPATSPAGPHEEFLKLLQQIREAQLKKDIDLFLSAYSPHFPDMDKKRQKTLKMWKIYDFREMEFTLDDLHQKDALTYLGKVTWNVKTKNVDTQEITASLKSYRVSFSQESGRWLIHDLEPLDDNR